nr:cobaltochelatase subunit CobN [Desulfurispora thermophila]
MTDEAAAKGYAPPEKVAAVVWCVETARDDGTMVSFVMRLLGVKPKWDKSMAVKGNVALDAAIQPLREAKLFDSVKGKESLDMNYVAKHWVEAAPEMVQNLKDTGLSEQEAWKKAGMLSMLRIFAPPVGDYGAGVSHAVEQAWTWDSREEIAELYLQRLGHAYSEQIWGENQVDIFQNLLTGVTNIFHSRSSNLYGALDNDDCFDYFGGLSMAVEHANNGQAPDMYILDYANPARASVTTLTEYLTRELRTRYYNPEWIKGMMEHGYSGAHTISNKFVSYLWGWQVTNPDLVGGWMWKEVVDIYLKDKYNLGVNNWLAQGNNAYALISVTGTMLTAAQKGLWQADKDTLKLVANTWAQAIIKNGVACCDCSCGNLQMMRWASNLVSASLLSQLTSRLEQATGVVLSERSSHKSKKSEHPVQQPASQTVPQPAQPEQNQPPVEQPSVEQPATSPPPAGEQSSADVPANTPGAPPAAAGENTAQPAGPQIAMAEQKPANSGPPISLPATANRKPASPGPGEKQGGDQPPLKAYEVQKETTKTAPPRPTVPLPGFIGVLALVVLSGIGFALRRRGR